MPIDNFIPEIWSTRLMRHLDKNLVFKQLVNTDYEGEIKAAGDTVRINQIGNITVKPYVKNVAIADPDQLDSAQQLLLIDQLHYYNFYVDDVDAAQSNVTLMDKAMARAAYALADLIDQDVAGLHGDAGITMDDGGAAYSVGNGVGDENPYDLIVDVGVKMDEHNVPREGRWIVIPPWYHGVLLKDDDYKQAWQNYMATGVVPVVAGFSVLWSNNLDIAAGGTDYHVLAGTREAISFAGQVNKTEAYRVEKMFADAIKGLYVYGRKVVQPTCLVDLLVAKA